MIGEIEFGAKVSSHANIEDNRCHPLDGVRGLAFVLVTLSHANDFLERPFFMVDGQTGVWLFFVLSSYLLAKNLFLEPEQLKRKGGWGNYAIRRFLRIYPLFIVYGFCLWYFAHVHPAKCFRVLALETTHAVDWSIYIEYRFYAVLLLIALPLVLGMRGRLYFASLVFVTVLLGAVLFPFWSNYKDWPFAGVPMAGWRGNQAFLPYLNCFLPGVAAAYLAVRRPASKHAVAHIADGIGVVVLFALLILPWMRQREPWENIDYGIISHSWFPYAVLFSCWVYFLSTSQGIFAKILSSRWFSFLGNISYPGYLFNIFIFYKLRPVFDNDWLFLVTTFMLISGFSYLLHITVELPAYRMARRAKGAGSRHK